MRTSSEHLFDTLPPNARVWVYMSDREFTEAENDRALSELRAFLEAWSAHGRKLTTAGDVLYRRFIVIMTDESAHGASGCSIDASVRFLQDLGRSMQTDLFNRMLLAYIDASGKVEAAPVQDLATLAASGVLTPDTLVFDNLVKTKAAFDRNWKVPLRDTRYMRFAAVS